MAWQVRHEGSPRPVTGLTLENIVEGLRDGLWEPTDEVKGPGDSAWVAIEDHPQLAEVVLDTEPPKPSGHRDETHLDLNALIDVTMVLLIFFIITTTYVTVVQKIVPLPRVATDESKATKVYSKATVEKYMIRLEVKGEAGKAPVVRLDDKVVQVMQSDGHTVDVKKLTELIKAQQRPGSVRTEMMLDAHGVNWGTVIAVQDAARAAGVQKVHHLQRRKA